MTLAAIWAGILSLLVFERFVVPQSSFWAWYVPVIFLIAGRQGALLQLIHEASHGLISSNRRTNRFVAQWLCAFPLGIFFDGYASGHLRHHAWTGTETDPRADREKYRVTDFRDPMLYLLFIKDLCGLTALGVFFAYEKGEGRRSLFRKLLPLCFVQLLVLGLFFQGNILLYCLLWIAPAMSPHMFLMRLRGIAEHGLPRQMGVETRSTPEGTLLTRSFLTSQRRYGFLPFFWLEKALIGSLDVHYHHEHHLFPSVPFYHLERLHLRIGPEIARRNPDVYASGYLTAAMRNILPGPERSLVPA